MAHNPKFQASSHLLWLYSLVCVGPGRKPRRPVFSQRGSYSMSLRANVSMYSYNLLESWTVPTTCACCQILIKLVIEYQHEQITEVWLYCREIGGQSTILYKGFSRDEAHISAVGQAQCIHTTCWNHGRCQQPVLVVRSLSNLSYSIYMNRLLRFGYAAERSEVNLLSCIQFFSAHISAVGQAQCINTTCWNHGRCQQPVLVVRSLSNLSYSINMNRLLRFGYAAERSEVNLLSCIQFFSAHISAVGGACFSVPMYSYCLLESWTMPTTRASCQTSHIALSLTEF